ncbi:RidA family protein [Sphingomonas lycopersici]|uniref:RidA family protein n=1 Tax=Sphingomonas lycopersici TaxID=2951807 RepID=A0AA41ZCM6_9SPHN|nr:RidA family protein [Sphingomonas lycopersici]MCW6536701.1 RidA family protein [Sphingomonas lycopersici]
MTTNSAPRQVIKPAGTEILYDNFRFAPATRVGNVVWVSGQVGIDAHMVPGDGMEAQARLAFQALKTALEAAGATMADIVELITFHIDLRGEMEDFAKVKDEFLPDRYPSWSAVGVTQLAMPELRVEVRAVAVIGSGSA